MMLQLYSSGGSGEIQLLNRRISPEAWRRGPQCVVLRILEASGGHEAADLFRRFPFELWEGTNCFGDEFNVLYAHVPLEQYVDLADLSRNQEARGDFRQIAFSMGDAGFSVRFIAVELGADSELTGVTAPVLVTASETLESALVEVERLLAEGRPAIGVDRIHTALHAYLKEIAAAIGPDPGDAGITAIFRQLRNSHPALQATGPRSADITRILQAMATILDALNPLRNRASLAHASEDLLDDAEAMLVINVVRTLLHYLQRRLHSS